MDNLPAFVFAELGCALAGAALVGLNPTRTGSALARDVEYADCQLVLVEARYAAQLARGDRRRAAACASDRRGERRRRWPGLDDGARRVDDRRSAASRSTPTRC